MFGRKAQLIDLILTPAFTTIFVLGIVLPLLLWYSNVVAGNTVYEREYLSRDFALMLDTALTVPGNLEVLSQQQLKGFTYEIQQDSVIVKDAEGTETKKYFLLNPNIKTTTQPDLTSPKLTKSGNTLYISDNPPLFNPFTLNCPQIPNSRFRTIVIDPGHAYNPQLRLFDSGYTFGEKKEAEETKKIARALQVPSQFKIKFTRSINPGPDQKIAIKQRINTIKGENPDLVLSIHFSNEEELFVKAFIPYKIENENWNKSRSIACNILNSLSDVLLRAQYPVSGVAVIPIDPERTSDDTDDVLLNEITSIRLELGSLNFDLDPGIVGKAILEGVENAQS